MQDRDFHRIASQALKTLRENQGSSRALQLALMTVTTLFCTTSMSAQTESLNNESLSRVEPGEVQDLASRSLKNCDQRWSEMLRQCRWQ